MLIKSDFCWTDLELLTTPFTWRPRRVWSVVRNSAVRSRLLFMIPEIPLKNSSGSVSGQSARSVHLLLLRLPLEYFAARGFGLDWGVRFSWVTWKLEPRPVTT